MSGKLVCAVNDWQAKGFAQQPIYLLDPEQVEHHDVTVLGALEGDR